MADNNVFILFEEIKTALNGIKRRVEELPNMASQQQQTRNDKPDLSPIKDVVTETAKAKSEEIKGLLERQWKAYAQLSTLTLQQLVMISGSRRKNKGNTKSCNHRSISTDTASTSSQARSSLLLWGLAWYALYLCGATSSNGSPNANTPTMR